ncbi:GNAT family N-acetyltransferase [Pseudomonas sp. KNUC1026]|uniref:GNAT family N-acetyltransferase n=1 Tax=Pseudomonas sp. KNUC1026 TaxID=2893890 RepID=UPI001F1CFD84|nr:GNAT family N-acetyltransferase [Pseudomonas sp. KNUC1026]UFH50508.1 GNAT family N-acetyltransferase [Pseudomonas sp. KNUC1026]
MDIRATTKADWMLLKHVRLAALLDAQTAFAVSYRTAAGYDRSQWEQRASSINTEFWLAFQGSRPVGMVGATVSESNRFNLIGMWVEPQFRGTGIAKSLVDTVKARSIQRGCDGVFLDVSPENTRASNFYLKLGFVFLDEWEPLESHPQISVQAMVWHSTRC